MSYDYYAAVRFPADAMGKPAIREWINEHRNYISRGKTITPYDDAQFNCKMVEVSCDTASSGRIGITDVLDNLQIPYEHYHRDDHQMGENTIYVRFVDGEKVTTDISAEDMVVRNAYQTLLDQIQSGEAPGGNAASVVNFLKAKIAQNQVPPLYGNLENLLATNSPQKNIAGCAGADNLKKFRVHTYQVIRVPYEVEAESQEQAAKLVHADGGQKLEPSSPAEPSEEWMPDSVVDPLLPNGAVDYENSRTIDLRSALDLRKEARALLEKAQALDGLRPYAVTHEFESGSSSYIAWGGNELSEIDAFSVLDSRFEKDRGESLIVANCFTLAELTGVAPASRVYEDLGKAFTLGTLKKAGGVVMANVDENLIKAKSQFEGKILGITANYVVQSIGRQAVIHRKAELSGAGGLAVGEMVSVKYKDGMGQVTQKEIGAAIER